MYESIILIGVIILTQIVKKYIYPKYGDTGIHVFTFVIACLGVGIYQAAQTYVEFKEILIQALNFLVIAVAVYEIILKKIGFKSAPDKLDESL